MASVQLDIFLSTDHSLQFASSGYSCTLLEAAQLDFLVEVVVLLHLFFGTDKTEVITQVMQCAPLLQCGRRWPCLNQCQQNKLSSSLVTVLICFARMQWEWMH